MSQPRNNSQRQYLYKVRLCQSLPAARLATLLLGCLLATVSGFAQDALFYPHSCIANLGGGFAPVAGSERSSLNSGWNFEAGIGAALGSEHRVAVTVDFMFDQLGVKQSALQVAGTSNPTNIGVLEATGGRAKYYTATFDPTYRFWARGATGLYVLGGFGWMRRSLTLTGVSGQGSLLEPNSPVVFANGGNSGALDVGAGTNVKVGSWVLYGEARVIHGLAANKSSTLVPVSVGIRW
jgi:hypothetical protein